MTGDNLDNVDNERGRRICALMDAAGLSNIDLAAECAVSSSTVTQWRTGHEIKTKYLPALARMLCTTIDHIVAGRTDPTPGECAAIYKLRRLDPKIRDAILAFIDKLPTE